MRILVVGDFDPCCVHVRQRQWLEPLGIEMRIAVRDRYWKEHAAIEWDLPRDRALVNDYAERCDLIVLLPAIEQPWAAEATAPVIENFGLLEWDRIRAPRMFVFHGSVNAAANAEQYAAWYRSFGTVAATTLDYVARMDAVFLPSIVDTRARARPRERQDGLRIVHAPSDARLCSTSQFREILRRRAVLSYVNSVPHADAMLVKARCHAGFDHLRGAFSINSLENAAIGLVNLVGTSDAVRAVQERLDVHPDWPLIQTMTDVSEWLDRLQDWKETVLWQDRGRRWFEANWQPHMVAQRIASAYRQAARA